MLHWLKSLFTKRVRTFSGRDYQLFMDYQQAGGRFGYAVSYLYLGECEGFEELLSDWEVLEEKYAAAGYRTYSLDDFVELGGYNKPLPTILVRRKEGERPIYHAKMYRERFLHKVEPVVDFQRLSQGEMQIAQYRLPSTKNAKPQD
jgi:hypothetical protein